MHDSNILVFIGARPNAPKVWTLLRALDKLKRFNEEIPLTITIVHSGQHYHELMGEEFARQFGIAIHKNLHIGSQQTDADQLAAMLIAIDQCIVDEEPTCIVVIGDVNTSLAAAIAASRRNVPVIHLEAGLRSGIWDPEEINRKIITACSRYHLAPSQLAVENLLREGEDPKCIYLVGNTMAESFLMHAHDRQASTILKQLHLDEKAYILFTVHKTHNLVHITDVINILEAVSQVMPVIFPCHPHTSEIFSKHIQIANYRLEQVKFLPPLPYNDMGQLIEHCRCTITDSAGIQEECAVAGIPCFTIGRGTARNETVLYGNNQIMGYDANICLELIQRVKSVPLSLPFWDDQVSTRIQSALVPILDDIWATQPQISWNLRPS